MAAKGKATRTGAARQDVPFRTWTVLAQDPSVTLSGGRALTTQVLVPAERLRAGPQGHRVQVVDYDSSTNRYFPPDGRQPGRDQYANVSSVDRLVGDPRFHAQNAYAIAMATLTTFESALGRPVPWGFMGGHQLKIAPHAFAEANAYYSRESEGLSFGYFFTARSQPIYTCLSHDIVAHETTHAVLDGLRNGYLRPSHPDQAGFHEGFADIVALLSVYQSHELIEETLALKLGRRSPRIPAKELTVPKLKHSVLAGLADEMGEALSSVRGQALRRSVELTRSPRHLGLEEYQEPHRRGEILVAAMMNVFLDVWTRRLKPLGLGDGLSLNRKVVAEEGATAAKQLLRIAIRALDYAPPIDLTFSNYLSSMLTADAELYPDDQKYKYRDRLRKSFAEFGIRPSGYKRNPDGIWQPPEDPVLYAGCHFDSLQRDPDAMFRFIWANQQALQIEPQAYTRVTSVRPCVRTANDQFMLRETVAEYVQTLQVRAGELGRWDIEKPDGMSKTLPVTLYGGGTLIFDEFGQLKYHIGKGVISHGRATNGQRGRAQTERLQSLWDRGYFQRGEPDTPDFAQLHRARSLRRLTQPGENW